MEMGKVLILTDGKAGHENQSKAFARALGCDFDLVEVHFRSAFHKALSYLFDHLGVHAWDKVIMANRKDLIFGDYLIDRHVDRHNVSDFMGTVIEFGSDTFKNWDDVLTFFGYREILQLRKYIQFGCCQLVGFCLLDGILGEHVGTCKEAGCYESDKRQREQHVCQCRL